MDYLPAGFARTDPIITQTCLSDHVHTFYGPQELRPETDHAILINSPDNINTGNVVENKSLYWHPTVYSYNRDSQTFTRDEMAQSSAYYIWENDFNPKAFPNGFKMIAGLDPTNPQNFPNAEAECVDPTPCTRPEGCYTENTFFPATACEELEVSMSFPTCWDGVNLDSADHQSHMRYTLDGVIDGRCPESHPVRLPQIQLFFRIMPYSGGWHTFSDMSSVFHADYVSGWDETKLQSVLDNCQTDSVAASPDSFCEEFLTFRDGPKCKDESVCDFGDPKLLAKLQAIQPLPLDINNIVSAEETAVVVGELPRGSCTGSLIPLEDVPSRAPSVPLSTRAPTVPSPPVAPNDPNTGDEDEDDTETGDEESDADEPNEDEGVDGHLDDEGIEDEEDHDHEPDEDEDEIDTGDEDFDLDEEEEDEGMDGDADDEGNEDEGDHDQEPDEDEDEMDTGDEDFDLDEPDEDEGMDGDADDEDTEDEGDEGETDHEDEVEDEDEPEDEDNLRSVAAIACETSCWDEFHTCEAVIYSICEPYFENCKQACLDSEAAGGISENELNACFDEWCTEDKELCYVEAASRCQNKHTECVKSC